MHGAKNIVDRLQLIALHRFGDAAKAFAHPQEQIFTFFKKGRSQGIDACHRHSPSTRLIV
jgi:hypothetical protein